METVSRSESRRLYSWWWDSHISPKNSKWLQDNLTDIDAKVKAMIKLIEEDADSFARRAEMYYKKRPELMKLVEEFYRAYRALAERYDHATAELRHAQKTIATVFPNQVDEAAAESEQDSPTLDILHPLRILLNADFGSEESKKGLKQLQEMFGASESERDFEGELSQLADENQNLKSCASKAENEIKSLKKALEELHLERDGVLCKYDESMEKLTSLEGELDAAKISSRGLNDEACKAKADIQKLNEVLHRSEAEKDSALLKLKEYRERIMKLEAAISLAQENEKGLAGRAVKAEAEAQCLEEELSELKLKNNAVCREYEQCLEKVSVLERKLLLKQEEAKLLNDKANEAENEVNALNKALAEASESKECIVRRYEHCLEKMTKLESELSSACDDINRLNSVVKMKSEKLRSVEEKCNQLESSNHALKMETDKLEKEIIAKSEELSRKDEEIERVQTGLQKDSTRFVQAEDTLRTLRSLHSQAQREQKALAFELKNGLKRLKEMEEKNNGLEEEMKQVKDENKVLNESNSSSKIVMGNLESEILNLKEMKLSLEHEVGLQMILTNTLQKEICSLNGDIEGLNTRYEELIKQIESVGLNPESLELSVKDLHGENTKLRDICSKERDEKENLVKELDNIKQFLEKNSTLESSLSALSGELKKAHEKVETLQDDKSSLVHEKAVILTQLQAITENMQKLLERNTFLENSLAGANAEISSLREKAMRLEELCKSLENSKSNLLNETSSLALQLENAENRREDLEKRYAELDNRYADLKKEKESTISQVEHLKTCLDMEKQERAMFTVSSETRLNKLEDHVQLLQGDNKSRKKEFEEEVDRAVNAQLEIFVLQRFIQDMEQKNSSLLLECQKHVEASKLSDKVISELERENLEQQVEAEFLLEEIEKLRIGIYQVFKALEISHDHVDKMGKDKLYFHRVVESIQDLKFALANNEDDRDQLLIENSVLLTLSQQLKLEASEFELEKKILQNDSANMSEQLVVVQNEKMKVMEMNGQLESDVKLRDQQTDELKAEIERLCEEQKDMKMSYLKLHDEHSQNLEDNKSLQKSLLDLKKKIDIVEDENKSILVEALALDNKSIVLEHFGAEKAKEAKSLFEDLQKLDGLKRDLENEVGKLKNEFVAKETENLLTKEQVEKLGKEINEVKDINSKLTRDLSVGKYFSNQKKVELLMVTEKLKAKEEVNSQLCRTVEELKKKNEENAVVIENIENHYLDLFEENKNQENEIQNLSDFNRSLEFEVGMLREEVEERKIREEKLNLELKEMSQKLKMWEADAEPFYSDFQTSKVLEAFLENKVYELSHACEMLEKERDSKIAENEMTKQRVSLLENENGALKNQLSAYDPVIDSLRENMMSLEQNTLSRQELYLGDIQKLKGNELAANLYEKSSNKLIEDDKCLFPSRVPELQQLQNRIKQVEKVVKEEMKRRPRLKRMKTNTKLEAALREIEELKANYSLHFEKGKQKQMSEFEQRAVQKTKPEFSETKNGMIVMKDIQLDDIPTDSFSGLSRRRIPRADDQMLELLETSEDDHSIGRLSKKSMKKAFGLINMSRRFDSVEPRSIDTSSEIQVEKELGIDRLEVPTSGSDSTLDRNKKKILERLICDSHKLKSIQTTVEDLRRKMDASKIKKKKSKNLDFEMLKEQFEEVDDTIIELVEVNQKLTNSVEENFVYSDRKATPELEVIGNLRRKRIADQARKGTEKIGRLLIEVQKIQYMLMKQEDEKKSKGKIRFPKSKTSIILRDFISGRRKSFPKKKNPYFGCLKTKSNNGEDERSIGELTYIRYDE